MERESLCGLWTALMTRRQMLTRVGNLGLGATALTGVPGGAERSALGTLAQVGGQVIVGISREAINLNPVLLGNTSMVTAPDVLMFDSLLKVLPDGQFVPNLAIEVPSVENEGISFDGLTWTFRLRNDVKWHDGAPFTSRDVLFTWQTVMNPSVNVRSRIGHDRVESVETPDDYTVIMRMREPFAPFMLVWTSAVTGVIPEHILSLEEDMNDAAFNTTAPVGTGPFILLENVPGDHLTVERNPDYHGEPAMLDRVVLQVVPESSLLFTEFTTGRFDVIDFEGIPLDRWVEAQSLEETVVKSPTNFVEFIYFNNAHPYFQDKIVKQALYHGIDVRTMIDAVYLGVHPETHTYLAPTHWAYNPDVTTYPYDPERANALLSEAGWERGEDGIRVKDGERLAFNNSTFAGSVTREAAQQIIQNYWREIGVELAIDNVSADVLWNEYITQSRFDTVMISMANDIRSDPDPTSRLGGGGANYSQFKNDEADELMALGVVETDQARRREIYFRLQALLNVSKERLRSGGRMGEVVT